MDLKRCKRSSQAEVANPNFEFLSLPDPVIFEILSWLPLKSVLRCHCVCKDFKRLLRTEYFATLHLSRAQTSFILRDRVRLYQIIDSGKPFRGSNSSLMELKQHKCFPGGEGLSENVIPYDFPSPISIKLVNSVNGLVCFYTNSQSDPCYSIWNPTFSEIVRLPDLGTNHRYLHYSALGFSPRSNQYKVIRFVLVSEKPVIQVHTLGTETWKCIEGAPAPRRHCMFDPFVNGALHWITESRKTSEMIYSFGVEKEELKPLPPPVHFNREYVNKISWIKVGKLGDALCLCYVLESTHFEVWVMKDYDVEESWSRKFIIDVRFYCGLQFGAMDRPLGFLRNGEMWLMFASKFLNSFVPRQGTFKDLGGYGVFRAPFDAVPHIPSLISLKDILRGKPCRVMKSI